MKKGKIKSPSARETKRRWQALSFGCCFGKLSIGSGTLFLFLMGLILTACAAPSPASAPEYQLLTPPASVSATPTPFSPALPTFTSLPPTATITPVPSATPTPLAPVAEGNPRPQYHLSAILDYEAHTMTVNETIYYTNQTGFALNALVLVVEANRYANCFVLEKISVNGAQVTPILTKARLDLPLGTPLEPNERITIEIDYTLNIPPKAHEKVFGYIGDYQTNIVDWYPFVAPYRDGWLIHEPTDVGEHMVYESADFYVLLKPVADYALVVAASAEGKETEAGLAHKLEGARTFVFSISPFFSSPRQTSQNARVTSFHFPNYEKSGEAILRAAAQAIDIYSNRYAPYPYESLIIVQTDLPDGMEYDGLIFMGTEFYDEYDGTIKNNLVSIGVHEVAHQWWYGLVGNDQALEPWLDESLSLYSERIYYESIEPYPVGWWWRWRVDWFEPSGWVDINIYDGYAFRGYTNAVYLRGAQFVEDLRDKMGEKAFNSFLQDYTRQFSYKIAMPDDFFDTLDQHTDEDYSDLLEKYFLNR